MLRITPALSKLQRGDIFTLFEQLDEMTDILDADFVRNRLYGQIRKLQQLLGVGHPLAYDVVGDGETGVSFVLPDQMVLADAEILG